VTSLLHRAVEGPVSDDRISSFPPACCCWLGTCRVGLRRRGPGAARSRPCCAARRSCAGAGRLPSAGVQFPVDCVLFLGGMAGAGAGRRRMPRGRWRPEIGGQPHRRPPSGANLIDVRLDVGPLPPRSSSPTVAGCWLGGFPVGRDRWGGERVVGGVLPASLPRINMGTDVWGESSIMTGVY
jgi:hypothetical protein